MNIKKKIQEIKNQTKNARLIIVTKHQDLKNIQKVYNCGEREFGENKVQELLIKKDMLPKNIKWHMIGHLQKNKVKLIAPFIYMIQSVDSIELLEIINKYGGKNNRKIKCLIQIKIAKEDTKFGLSLKHGDELFKSNCQKKYPNIVIEGIMGMATFTNNARQIQKEFEVIKTIFQTLKNPKAILSIGMSNDYQLAYKLGSNMIRIGSAIFK